MRVEMKRIIPFSLPKAKAAYNFLIIAEVWKLGEQSRLETGESPNCKRWVLGIRSLNLFCI